MSGERAAGQLAGIVILVKHENSSETRKLNFMPILTFQAIFTHKYKSNLLF
jgi:hypothetical protein